MSGARCDPDLGRRTDDLADLCIGLAGIAGVMTTFRFADRLDHEGSLDSNRLTHCVHRNQSFAIDGTGELDEHSVLFTASSGSHFQPATLLLTHVHHFAANLDGSAGKLLGSGQDAGQFHLFEGLPDHRTAKGRHPRGDEIAGRN